MCTVFSVFKITCISRLDFPMNLEAWLTLRVSTKELKPCVRYSAKERDAGSADLGLLACSEFPGTRALTELIGSHIFPKAQVSSSAELGQTGREETKSLHATRVSSAMPARHLESLEISESLCVFPAVLLYPRGARSQSPLRVWDQGPREIHGGLPDRISNGLQLAW